MTIPSAWLALLVTSATNLVSERSCAPLVTIPLMEITLPVPPVLQAPTALPSLTLPYPAPLAPTLGTRPQAALPVLQATSVWTLDTVLWHAAQEPTVLEAPLGVQLVQVGVTVRRPTPLLSPVLSGPTPLMERSLVSSVRQGSTVSTRGLQVTALSELTLSHDHRPVLSVQKGHSVLAPLSSSPVQVVPTVIQDPQTAQTVQLDPVA
jgi:hypothetical protein